MADIQYIHNVVSNTVLTTNDLPIWSTEITGMPDSNPDEAVIRSITFNAESSNDVNTYMIWCNMKNGFIGTICGTTTSTPQTRIRLNSLVPNSLQFQLFAPMSNGSPVIAAALTGDLVIHMDFIKYKKVPIHA